MPGHPETNQHNPLKHLEDLGLMVRPVCPPTNLPSAERKPKTLKILGKAVVLPDGGKRLYI
jgi:hypothetical protein